MCFSVIALLTFLGLGWKSVCFRSLLIRKLELCFQSIATFIFLLEKGNRSLSERRVMEDSCFSKYVRNNHYILFKVVKLKKAGSL